MTLEQHIAHSESRVQARLHILEAVVKAIKAWCDQQEQHEQDHGRYRDMAIEQRLAKIEAAVDPRDWQANVEVAAIRAELAATAPW